MTGRDRVGLGWRGALAASIYTHLDAIDVLEVVAEDLMAGRQRLVRSFRSVARERPVLCHGITLGPASVLPPDRRRLDRLARVIGTLEPAAWSEHLAFVRSAGHEIGHLAAPPRNAATVDAAVRNLRLVAGVVGKMPAVENIATLIDPPDSGLSEPVWVTQISTQADAPLLLDLHNLYANAVNFGHDPDALLHGFPLARVRVVHLSGGRWIPPGYGDARARPYLLDDHLHDVPDPVYRLLESVGAMCPLPLDVIIERDGGYPAFADILNQLDRARQALAAGRRRMRLEREATLELATT